MPEPPRPRRGRRLADRPVHQHVTCEPRRDGQRRRDDRSDLPGYLGPRDVPAHRESERVLHLGDAGAGEAGGRRAHGTGVGSDAVDVVGVQSGIRDGAQRRLDGQVHVGAEEPPPDRRLPDAGEDGATLEPLLGRHASRRARQRPRRCRCAWAASRASCAGRPASGRGASSGSKTGSAISSVTVRKRHRDRHADAHRRRERSRRCWS